MRRTPGLGLLGALFLCCLARELPAQRHLAGAAQTRLALDRLNNTGRALMIAAHPDDENTALLAWLARGRHVRTGYLSLTRGEGGQNLIGPEQGRLLGVIRTEELLAARRIDGAEQFFTSAADFGFSKSVEETLAKWNKEKILGEIVWTIRKFRPHVIILRFSGTPRDGHGHHQASALLGKEAFFAAADPKRFPEQLGQVEPWQATRVVWNVFSFTREQEEEAARLAHRLEVDLGEYNPLLGHSYAEIAGMSRSEHQSQGMGSPETRGSVRNFLVTVAGKPARKDLFDDVALGWTGPAAEPLQRAAAEFDPRAPHKVVPLLLAARPHVGQQRRAELGEAIGLCLGLWADASTDRPFAVGGARVQMTEQVVNRSPLRVEWDGKELPYNRLEVRRSERVAGESLPNRVAFRLRVEGQEFELSRPVHHRFVDKVLGERTRPFFVVPPVSVRFYEPSLVFPTAAPRRVEVRIEAFAPAQKGTVRLDLPAGWRAAPAEQSFELASVGQETTATFKVTPPESATSGLARAVARCGGREVSVDLTLLDYPHIPAQIVAGEAQSRLVRANIRIAGRRVGYIMGAGDEIPAALRQIGYEVTLLPAGSLGHADLSGFDAIVTGVRAFNTHPGLVANRGRLMQYVENGGTLVIQYNVLERNAVLDNLGPYPFRTGRERVTLEDAPVEVLRPGHPLLTSPNRITAADFEGWVQERGLYFASEWDPRYEAPLATHDPGEKPLAGGLLYARYGKGVYIFTAYSWFRQLPAGVPGAYRLFANLLAGGKAP